LGFITPAGEHSAGTVAATSVAADRVMNKQVDVHISNPAPGHRFGKARWMICDNGMTVAEGEAGYDPESAAIDWFGNPPATEYYVDVAFEIDRAVRRRQIRSNLT